MQKKKIFAMLLSAMIVMSATAVSVSAEVCDGTHHNFSNGVCTNDECEATCNCDNTGATCTTAGTCSVCGKEGTPLGHTELVVKEAAVAATCTTAGKTAVMGCSRCDDINEGGEATDVLEHNYTVDVDDASNKAATCTAAGSQMKKCSSCDATQAQEIAQLQHSYVGEYKYDAEGTTHTRKCTNGCEGYGAEETCADNGDGTCVCGRTMAAAPECTHESTKYVQVGETQHKKICADEECAAEVEAAENCDNTTESACTKCDRPAKEAPAEECEHTFTYTFKADGKHTKDCSKEDCDFEAVDEECELEDGKCKWCGNEPAGEDPGDEPEDKPTTGGSSSSSSTTKPSVSADAEADKIKGAEAGQKVEVKIDGNTVPAAYVQAALSSKATVVVDYGTYAWEISDVKQVKAVDLSINTNARYLVEQGALKGLKGDNSNVIDIAHDGNLGFKGTLKYNVRKSNAGKFVNLYYYNTKTKKLELQGSTKIGADGNVLLPFTHCSTYVLNITATPASNELFEDFSAGESATVVEDTLPAATNAPAATEAPATTDAAANPETGNSAAALMAIPMAIAAAAIISKKR